MWLGAAAWRIRRRVIFVSTMRGMLNAKTTSNPTMSTRDRAVMLTLRVAVGVSETVEIKILFLRDIPACIALIVVRIASATPWSVCSTACCLLPVTVTSTNGPGKTDPDATV
jgi:hypothetical protein